MKEISDIKELIESLEKKVCELEAENRSLKNAIISACNSLTRQNSELLDYNQSSEEVEEFVVDPFEPFFQSPLWTKK